MNYKEQYSAYLNQVESYLLTTLNNLSVSAPSTIKSAMNYAVLDGGKRVRPVLCLAVADILQLPFDRLKEFAVAIELVHSYSLVHDDLPAMDNDDFRRGKPSTHKKFGEANAILAGDALLNYAFELCLSKENFNALDAKALKLFAEYAGYDGMIAGQILDLESQGKSGNSDLLYQIYFNKTAKLIMCPILIASILKDGQYYKELYDFGYNLGVMFQIIDDIMDVEGTLQSIGKTPNKDLLEDKLTSIKLFGLDGAKQLAKKHYDNCLHALKNIPNNKFLLELTQSMFDRRK